jgi:hypothetical protein
MENHLSRPVMITCPSCKKETSIDIPEVLVKNAPDNVLRIHVPMKRCCGIHAFMVFIDSHFKVRGYQAVDIEYTQSTGRDATTGGVTLMDTREILDVFGLEVVGMMLRAILVNKHVFMLDSFDVYHQLGDILRFFKEIESTDLHVSIDRIMETDLKAVSKERNHAFVCSLLHGAVLQSPFKKNSSFAIEIEALKETSKLPDRQAQIGYLQLELARVARIADGFAGFLQGQKKKYYEEDVPAFIMDHFNYKMQPKHLPAFKEILALRHAASVASKLTSKYSELGFVSI